MPADIQEDDRKLVTNVTGLLVLVSRVFPSDDYISSMHLFCSIWLDLRDGS